MDACGILIFLTLIIIIFYKILACDYSLDKIISWEINFVANLHFEGCDCVDDYEVFSVFCKNYCYNVVGSTRIYFASAKCCSVKTDLNEYCIYCRWILASLNYSEFRTLGRTLVRFIPNAIVSTQDASGSKSFDLLSVEDFSVLPNSAKLIRTDIGFKISTC